MMNEEVMKLLGDNDPVVITEQLEATRIRAVRSTVPGASRKENEYVRAFYDLYYQNVAKPVLEHFVGTVSHSHENGAVHAKVNEIFRIVYGRDISPTFERATTEDHVSGTYKGVSFDQVDVVITKGTNQKIFYGRAIQYGFSTGIPGRIVIMEKGTFEGIGGGEETEKAKDDFSDLEQDGIFGGFDAEPSAQSVDHARSVNNHTFSQAGTIWANDTADSKLFPTLTKSFSADAAFQQRFVVFSDDPTGTNRILTAQLTGYMTGINLPGSSCLIIERDRMVLLRNKISGLMELNLESPIDLTREVEKNYAEMQETVQLLDALRNVSATVAEENSSFEV